MGRSLISYTLYERHHVTWVAILPQHSALTSAESPLRQPLSRYIDKELGIP